MKILNKKIILASKSPRRSQLLKEAGFSFEVRTKDVEESYPSEMPVMEIAEFLARKKATACEDFLEFGDLILTADSVVILEEEIFEKPKDIEDAKRILRRLSGKAHEVVTGVCLLSKGKRTSFSGISKVYFQTLSEEEIDYYIKTCKPFDKAGAYGIQEWIGHCKITKIEGLYTNIMGLPVELVYQHLKDF